MSCKDISYKVTLNLKLFSKANFILYFSISNINEPVLHVRLLKNNLKYVPHRKRS